MSLTALCLVILAALVHATWNYFLKKANANRSFWWVVYCITAIVTVPALYFYNPHAFDNITAIGWLVICLSAPIHVCYGVVLQQGYKKSDYSIVYPTARGTGPLISVLAAITFLGNTPTVWGWLGIVSILVAIVLLAMPSQEGDARNLRVKEGVFLGNAHGAIHCGLYLLRCVGCAASNGLDATHLLFPIHSCSLFGFCSLYCDKRRLARRSQRTLYDAAHSKESSGCLCGLPLGVSLGALRHDHGALSLCGAHARSGHDDWGCCGRIIVKRTLKHQTRDGRDWDDVGRHHDRFRWLVD